jgi:hypothetical protein
MAGGLNGSGTSETPLLTWRLQSVRALVQLRLDIRSRSRPAGLGALTACLRWRVAR